jgi:universal stress protein E
VSRTANILVIVDPLASDQPALTKTGTLAKLLGASVEVLLCDTPISLQQRIARHHSLEGGTAPQDVRAWLDGLAAPLRGKDIEVTTATCFGDPLHEGLLKYLGDSPADLIVKDTHHHSVWRRTFLSNTDWHLIRECSRPLLLTKPTRWHEPLRLAAAVDPGHPNDPDNLVDHAVLKHAAAFATASKSNVDIFHSYFPAMLTTGFDAGFPMPVLIPNEVLDTERTLHELRVTELLDGEALPRGKQYIEMGVASDFLPRAALEAQTDVIVMGAISRSRLKQATLGGTAERLLEHLPCDILTVKPVDWAACLPLY